MNVFRFELRAQLRGFLVWTVSLLGVFLLLILGFYGPFMSGRETTEQALASLPPAFSAVFGVELDRIFSYGGFFQFLYTYIGLMGAIMASSLALAAFSREKRAKCVDFLLTKPISRGRAFLLKLLSCLALLVLFNFLFLAASMAAYAGNGQEPSGMGTLALASSSLFFMQLTFLSIGALYAVLARRVRSVSGTATALGFAGFLLMALCSLTREEALRYLSPLTYFSPQAVFLTGGFEIRYVLTAAAVIAACAALAYGTYCHSDTRAI